MGVNFSPIEIGRRALRASQMGLAVTGQNIANVNTPGYTRQQVQLAPIQTDLSNMTMTGAGVTVEGVRSFRDRFVESRLQRETAITGRLTAQRDALAPVDAVFDESAGGGISDAMQSFFGSFRELEAYPTSVPLRAVVVEKGSALAASFRSTYARLQEIREDTDAALRSTATEVNSLAQQIASLNQKIRDDENSGVSTTELRDQRGEAVKRLAELSGAYAVEAEDHTLTVTLGDGRALVVGDRAKQLESVPMPPDGLSTLMLDGTPAVFNEGRLRGLSDAIDQITNHLSALDDLAGSLAARVNALHTSGTDLNGLAGANFFEPPVAGGTIGVHNLRVSQALKNDPRGVVASPTPPPATTATVAGAIANLLTDTSSTIGPKVGSFSSVYAQTVAEAGAGVKSAAETLQTQQAILEQVTAQREAISGVSLDEEAINLLQYQRAYEAAARFLQVADEVTQAILALGQ